MTTITLSMLNDWLKDFILWYHGGSEGLRYDSDIRFLDHAAAVQPESLSAKSIYLGEADVIVEVLQREASFTAGCCLISAGEISPEQSLSLSDTLSLIVTDLSLIELYNRLQPYMLRLISWDTSLHEVVYQNSGLQEMLNRASTEIHATMLLLNTGYKHIASIYDADIQNQVAEEIKENGYLRFKTIDRIHHESPLQGGGNLDYCEYLSTPDRHYVIVRLIRFHENLVARLCVILSGPDPNPYYSDLSAILASYIAEYMFSNQGVDYSSNAEFGILAADLIECRLTDPEELEQRLKQIKLAVRRYYHVMLVSFDRSATRETIPWNHVINQLEYIFPFSNITTYKGEILLIIRKMKRGRRLVFDTERLEALLKEYDGYASIGNTSEFLTSLPPLYHQTHDALRLGKAMDPEKRIYYYEDYSTYQIIELAAEAARQKIGSRNLVHLCNNEIIALVLYDKKKGTNLTDIAYSYLSHERNTSETAKDLFIHRNTMLNKIKKIEEVIGTSLDNPLVRERLMFSYHVFEYMRKYLKEDILVLKRTKTEQ